MVKEKGMLVYCRAQNRRVFLFKICDACLSVRGSALEVQERAEVPQQICMRGDVVDARISIRLYLRTARHIVYSFFMVYLTVGEVCILYRT